MCFYLVLMAVLTLRTPMASSQLVLDQNIMELTYAAAALSLHTSETDDPLEAVQKDDTFDWTQIQVFTSSGPDLAIVAKFNGYCFAAFRGSRRSGTLGWLQNLDLASYEICVDNNSECCTTRRGYHNAYDNSMCEDVEAALRSCSVDCANPNECVVLTGHSRGGAIAGIASVYNYMLKPYVITFGQPATIDSPCPLVNSSRWLRFVNSIASDDASVFSRGIVYDGVPFLPDLNYEHFGHMILLGDDPGHVAYVGLDVQTTFSPVNIYRAHYLDTGYFPRIQSIREYYETTVSAAYPVQQSGYSAGSACTKDVECTSEQCKSTRTFGLSKQCSGETIIKLRSCERCVSNSDCLSGQCSGSLRRCAETDGLMSDDCDCFFGSDCRSGRCDGTVPHRVCQSKLSVGSRCNEDNDCQSGVCSWLFKCSGN